MKGYPVFLIDLQNKNCVVIGGNLEAERKVKELHSYNAVIAVISPQITSDMTLWAKEGKIQWLKREYSPGDLDGAFLALATEFNQKQNQKIWEEAEQKNVLLNAIDDPSHCHFIAGSIVRQGNLTVAISTNGCAPALAVRLRERLSRQWGQEYAIFLSWMQQLRKPIKEMYSEFSQRRAIWYALVDSDILFLLKKREFSQAYQKIVHILGENIEKYQLPFTKELCALEQN